MANARCFKIVEDEIRRIKVTVLVDTGAYELCINENLQSYLNLPLIDKKTVQMADGSLIRCGVVGPIEVRFGNRYTSCNAYLLPGDSEPLLGVIPMESMDVLVDPGRQELIVNPDYPDFAYARI